MAYYLGEINVIHPFREGNGRTQRLFIEYLAGVAGYGIDFSEISPREMIIASAEAFNCQYDKMEDIFKRSVYPLSEQEQEDNIRLFFGNEGNEMRLFHTRDDEPKMFM
ncbi:MAG: Fic family protein [Clostridia bacterium]|nr:Fic family protein [Clostridia bacterium]